MFEVVASHLHGEGLLDGVPLHLQGEGLLDRGVQHLHRPPAGLHLPARAQTSHWLLISPFQGRIWQM